MRISDWSSDVCSSDLSQYGSVRVREKSAELQRVAADAVKIAAEIIAENFSKETVLDMSQMDVPTKADITRRIKEIEKAAKEELEGLKARAQEAMQNQTRSEKRREGKEGGNTCRSRWAPTH